jgi:hypothetical protein
VVKEKELTDPNSYLNRAMPGEMLFVLLGRDASTPVAIKAWIVDRLRTRKNNLDDEQIQEALACVYALEKELEIL